MDEYRLCSWDLRGEPYFMSVFYGSHAGLKQGREYDFQNEGYKIIVTKSQGSCKVIEDKLYCIDPVGFCGSVVGGWLQFDELKWHIAYN